MSSVIELEEAISMTSTPLIKVVRHDIDDSVQTRGSSGMMRGIQSTSIRADEVTVDLDDPIMNVCVCVSVCLSICLSVCPSVLPSV